MRLVIICGSLELGMDGVGDYTRRLAAECIRLGHDCRAVSLNDKQVKARAVGENAVGSQSAITPTEDYGFLETQYSEGVNLHCLRMPASLAWTTRVRLAAKYVSDFKPDWVSVQFVPFGFDPKGLPFGLSRRLLAITGRCRVHLMFHELWLGSHENAKWKHRLWGATQRRIILNMILRLRPKIVVTHAEPYRVLLAAAGVNASILPLFGNVPVAPGDAWDVLLKPMLSEALGQCPPRNTLYLAGVFGAVHPEWDAESTTRVVLDLARRFQKRLVLIFLGKSNVSPELAGRLRTKFPEIAAILLMGQRPVQIISQILQTLDLGLATTPLQMIQKSGSVAAMSEHGLPVLVTRDDWRLRGQTLGNVGSHLRLFTAGQFAGLEELPTSVAGAAGESLVRQVAREMLESLTT